MKSLARFPIFTALILALIVASVTTPIIWRLMNENIYKDALEDADVYNQASDAITSTLTLSASENLSEYFYEQMGQRVSLSNELESKIQTVVSQSLNDVFPPELVQTTVETNLDYFFDYYGGADQLNVFIPKEEILNTLEAKLPLVITNIQSEVRAFPTCSDGQIDQLINGTASTDSNEEIVIDCIPQNIKDGFLAEERLVFLNNIDEVVDELAKENAIFASDDTTSLQELLEAGNQTAETEEEKTDVESVINNLEESQDLAIAVRSGILMSWLTIAVLALLFVLLSNGNIWQRLRSLALNIIFVELLVIGFFGIFKFILINRVFTKDAILELFENDSVSTELVNVVYDFVTIFFDKLIMSVILFAIILLIVGLIILVVSIVMNKEGNTKEVKLSSTPAGNGDSTTKDTQTKSDAVKGTASPVTKL